MKANVFTSMMMSLVLMGAMVMAGSDAAAQTMQGRKRPDVASTNGNSASSNTRGSQGSTTVSQSRDNNRGTGRPTVTQGRDNNRDNGRPAVTQGRDNRGNDRPTGTQGRDNRGHDKNRPATRPNVTVGSHSTTHAATGGPKRDWRTHVTPPHRDHRPKYVAPYRPLRPVSYRPLATAPVIDRVFGLYFGTRYGASLDYLYTNGYYIDGYYDNVIYLRDVTMAGMLWQDAMLTYDNYSRLTGAQLYYSTAYSDRSRYNTAFRNLCATYGTPISEQRSGFDASVTWWGGNATGYVTLTYGLDAGRFYTTLTIGN